MLKEITYGIAENEAGERISIRGVKAVENTHQVFDQDVYGYEFFHGGEAIGAVSILNNGKVWLRNDLEQTKRLIVASLASSLMLRDNLKRAASDNDDQN